MLRLNLGNWMVMDVSARGGVLHLTALIEPMAEVFAFAHGEPFKRADDRLAVFAIPLATARTWPDELQRIYAESLLALAERFGSYGGSPHWRAHQPEAAKSRLEAALRLGDFPEREEAARLLKSL